VNYETYCWDCIKAIEMNWPNFVTMGVVNCLLIAPPDTIRGNTRNKTGVRIEDAGEYIRFSLPKEEEALPYARVESEDLMYHFSYSFPFDEIRAEDFDLLFIAGGYGAMWNFEGNRSLKQLLGYFIRENKPMVWLAMVPAQDRKVV
jgi:hypothetical protein